MKQKFLMCRPEFFAINYSINPWMADNIGKVDKSKAHSQWNALYNIVASLADVELLIPRAGLPDMVFTANAGIIIDNVAWVSTFSKLERHPEEYYFDRWYRDNGLTTIHVRRGNFSFEGAGDCLVDSAGEYWIGSGIRTKPSSAVTVATTFPEHSWHHLKLQTEEFYHLDTCFCPLSGGEYLYYPDAFQDISELVAMGDRAIAVDGVDADNFACNAVCIDNTIIVNTISDKLNDRLTALGYTVIMTDMSEFIKSGGSVKCLTLLVS